MAEIRARLALDSSAFEYGLTRARSAVASFAPGLASAFSVAGIAYLGKQLLSTASTIYNLSQRTGLSTDEIQRFGFAAEATGTTADRLALFVVRLQRNSQAAQMSLKGAGDQLRIMGESGETVALSGNTAAKAIQRLGINAEAFFKMAPAEQLMAVADGLKRTGDLGAVFDLLGRGASVLLPLLRMNREEIEKLLNIPRADSETIQSLERVEDNLLRLWKTMQVGGMLGLNFVGTFVQKAAFGADVAIKRWQTFFSTISQGYGATLDAIEAQEAKFREDWEKDFGVIPPVKPLPSFTPPTGPTEAESKAAAALEKQNDELRERIKLVAMSADEEIAYLEEKKRLLESMPAPVVSESPGQVALTELPNTWTKPPVIETEAAQTKEKLEIELKLAELRKRQAAEQERAAETLRKTEEDMERDKARAFFAELDRIDEANARVAELQRAGYLAGLTPAEKILALEIERTAVLKEIDRTDNELANARLRGKAAELQNEIDALRRRGEGGISGEVYSDALRAIGGRIGEIEGRFGARFAKTYREMGEEGKGPNYRKMGQPGSGEDYRAMGESGGGPAYRAMGESGRGAGFQAMGAASAIADNARRTADNTSLMVRLLQQGLKPLNTEPQPVPR